jgi:hypothetical protein
MGTVEIDEAGNLRIRLDSPEDRAALRTALRCAVDADPVEVADGAKEVIMDAGYPEHFLIARACGFRWSEQALLRAVDELIPYARQSIAMHSTMRLKSQQRWMKKISEGRRGVSSPNPEAGPSKPTQPT